MSEQLYAVWTPAGDSWMLAYVGPFVNCSTCAPDLPGSVVRRATDSVALMGGDENRRNWRAYNYTLRENAIAKYCAWANEYQLNTRQYWIVSSTEVGGDWMRVECHTQEQAEALAAEMRLHCFDVAIRYGNYYN